MNTTVKTGAMAATGASGPDITDWRPEDEAFWESTGKKVAYRNLWISIPALLCGFAVWGMWGIITVQMLNLGFPFTQAELFTLTAIAGIAGATMRIPASFFIRLAGGRNTIFLTTAMLLAPAIGTGIALQHPDWPLWVFQLMALWSGVGGGNFASSMSNINTFFPKRLQGTALGLNAGLGNFGVTTMQIVIPLVMTVGIFGAFGGEPMTLVKDSGWIGGKILAGTPTWIQNAGFAWVLSLVPLSVLCWWGMNNLKTVSPHTGSPIVAFAKITYLYTLAFVPAIFMLYLYLPKPTGLGVLSMWVAIPLDIILALMVMKLAAFGEMKEGVKKQFAIFKDKHTWSLTALYIVTFGSFIGFSMALPLAITVIFGFQHVPDANGVMTHTLKNPNAPSALTYAWIGPFVGAAVRPIGGWISDKLGGSIVTQVITVVMAAASVAVGYVMMQAYGSATPEQYFPMFLGLFMVLFFASGIGNGSTFRTIGVIFDRTQAGPVLGWTSAVAAYGAFIAPVLIGEQIKAGTPQAAFYGFAVFYALCLVLNWWFYLRGNAYVKNP
ncbi:MAG: MFS transporter [Rubrivivax sp.]|jgi:NNP family nitrate/nitrite transporter-like MFS transporter|nr:MFS transporter [Rubrivivax sp.]MBP6466283.1 MFS transporter [Rubrivivax sp.]MBP9910105.1 MFS transporter [Rubrivivax sp.]